MSKKLLAHALCAYIGTKSVLATTMTRGEYNEYRGWQIPENEDPSEQGYLVEYVDGGKPNDDRHAGYISWSPRDVFEKSYHQSQTPQDRVRLEQRELYTKLMHWKTSWIRVSQVLLMMNSGHCFKNSKSTWMHTTMYW